MVKNKRPVKPSKRVRKAYPHCSSSMERATKKIRETTRFVRSIRKLLRESWKLVKLIIVIILTILLLLGYPSAL